MLTRDGKELRIFSDFVVDRTLPKYSTQKTDIDSANENDSLGTNSGVNSFTFSNSNDVPSLEQLCHELITALKFRAQMIPTLKNKVYLWVAKLMFNKLGDEEVQQKIDPQKFFEEVKTQFSYISGTKEVEKYYLNSIEQARKLGQTALVEKLVNQRNTVLNECKLKENKINQFVTEDQVIDFYKSVGKPANLKLSWIKNFTRIIPSEAVKLKEKADQLHVFDNYVILHYDPEGNAEEDTQKEKEEKEKDPILFGVMENSRRLYFIADWEDAYCDLTLEKMMEELGDEANKVNNETIKSYIDK